MYQRYIKRILDTLLAGIAMILLTPLFLVVMLIIKIETRGPAVFTQERMGKDGKPFKIYKFRTMQAHAPSDIATELLVDSDYWITRFGKFLRKTSIDELPQLLNIVKGEMAIVGPRPVVLTQKGLIESRLQYGVYSVLPGLTGWAQINGRDLIDDDQKVALDVEYLHKMSFTFDVMCIYRTVFKVAKAEGIIEGKIED